MQLVPNDDAEAVRLIFTRRAEGATYKQLAELLAAKGLRGPFDYYPNRGRIRHWTDYTVRSILQNPVYVGQHRFNRRTPLDTSGRRRTRPEVEWVVVENAHPALVDRRTWEIVQARFTETLGPRSASRYLLTGLLTCASCGSKIVGGGGSRPKAEDPERTMMYRCKECREPMLTVNKRWLEGTVIYLVGDFVTDLVEGGLFDRLLSEILAGRRSGLSRERAQLAKRRTQLEKQRDRLVDAVANGLLTDAEAHAKLQEIRAKLDEVEPKLQQRRFEDRAETLNQDEIEALRAKAADLPARLKKAPSGVARALLAEWLDSIKIDGESRRVTVTLWRLPVFTVANQARRPSGCSRCLW